MTRREHSCLFLRLDDSLERLSLCASHPLTKPRAFLAWRVRTAVAKATYRQQLLARPLFGADHH